MDNIPPLYTADALQLFGVHTAIAFVLVIAGVVLFPILLRRASTWPARIGIVFACAVLFLFGMARLVVIAIAISNGPANIVAPLDFKTQVNNTGKNGTILSSFVLAFFDKTKGTRDEINSIPTDDRMDRYIKIEVSENAFDASSEGICYEFSYYPLPRYVPMFLFFKSLDSDPFTARLQNADMSQCQ